jgi:pimeloyl-ACP methyl ester carboxylesterase
MKTKRTRSADGTTIAFEALGNGAPVVLVGGELSDRTAPTSGKPLAAMLAHRFTVFSYDRRGRGDSGDTPSWTIKREIEDLAALIAAAGGSASVFGNSSGGLLSLDAAAQGQAITRLAVYEPPIILDAGRAASFLRLANQLDEAAAADRRNEAVELYFSRVMQMPAQAVAQLRRWPMWADFEDLAHTLSYDLRITARGAARLAEAPAVRPPTLAMDGSESPSWMRDAIEAVARAIPRGRHRTLEGQAHAVDPKALALALEEFLSA